MVQLRGGDSRGACGETSGVTRRDGGQLGLLSHITPALLQAIGRIHPSSEGGEVLRHVVSWCWGVAVLAWPQVGVVSVPVGLEGAVLSCSHIGGGGQSPSHSTAITRLLKH